jgi:16S rRNA (guanine527-N7)-methyltransferase
VSRIEDRSAGLARLVARYALGDDQRDQLAKLLAHLETDDLAPTSPHALEHALDVHLADSLVALELEHVRGAARIADLGAGAGFPGLPLAIALGGCELALIESNARRAAFIADAAAHIGLANARAVCVRAEAWDDGIGANDVVVARALGPQPMVLEYAAPLLALGGTLVDWRGRRVESEELAAASAAAQLGLARAEVRRVEPYAGARGHHLHVFTKEAETPARFPRRVGIARKRPLGA